MNKRILGTFVIVACVGLSVFMLPSAADAQGALRYQNRYSKAQVSDIIARLESSSNRFRGDFDNAMDRSTLNGTSEEDRYNGLVKDYENALNRLRRDFDRSNSWGDARNNVQSAIQRAQPVNDMMNSIAFRRNLERQWASMRNDINTLADTFDLPGLNGGGWMGGNGGWNGGNNGGQWGGSGNVSAPPTWAQGTFYSADGNITLSIDGGGRATVVNGGQSYWGNYYRGNLTVNGDTSAVQQSGNGIRTYNRNTGQTTMYSRTPTYNNGGGGWNGGNNGGNNGGGWGGSGNVSNPPTWAQGTFYSPDGNITLSIDAGGRVTVVNGGQTFYGNYYRGNLTLNGDTSSVSQSGNGIRTYNRSNGQTTIYSRNYNGNNGGNNGGWNGGGNTSAPPSWAQGTFYSTDGLNISLTINNNGEVTAMVNGQMFYGTYAGGSLSLNGDVSTVSRNGNGIRTYNTSTRQTTNYRR